MYFKEQPWRFSRLNWVGPFVSHHAVHLVDGGGEGAQAHLLWLVDYLWARLLPLVWNHQVFISVDQEIKGTCSGRSEVIGTKGDNKEKEEELTRRLQQREEGNRGCYLPDDRADLILNDLDGFLPGSTGNTQLTAKTHPYWNLRAYFRFILPPAGGDNFVPYSF